MERMQAFRKPQKPPKYKKERKIPDMIITTYSEEEEIQNDGTKIIKRVPRRINLTKKINASAKMIKKETTANIEEKLNEVFEVKKQEILKEIKKEK